MIKFLFLLIFIVFPFGELTKLPIGLSEINLSFLDLVVGTIVTIWLIGLIGQICRKKKIFWPVLTKPIFLFVLAAGFSLLVNSWRLKQEELMVAGLYLLRWMVYAGVYFVVRDIGVIREIRKMLLGVGIISAVFGLLQYFLYPDLRNLSYLGFDPHKFRAFGTFLDPNFLGIILVLTIILIVDSRWTSQGHPLLRPFSRLDGIRGKEVAFKTIFGFCCYLVLALTYSRASYLAYFVSMGMISFFRKTPKLFLAAVLIGVLTLSFLPKPSGTLGVNLQRQESVFSRIKNWEQSLVIAKDHPLFGVGFNAYRYAQKDYGFLKEEKSRAGAGGDASLFFVLATTGIIGVTAYLHLIYDILIYHIRKQDYIVVASLLAVFVHSFFNNTLFYPPVMLWLWMLIGIDKTNMSDKPNKFMGNK